MGREAEVLTKLDGQPLTATARLETDFLRLREPGLTVHFSEIERCEIDGEWLMLRYGGRTLELRLGALAERWWRAIVSPPTLLDKLGVKPGLTVAELGFDEPVCPGAATSQIGTYDLVLLHAPDADALAQLSVAREAVTPRGGLWIVYPRGSRIVPERLVREVALTDGWVDVKTCRFDETRTALKFVRRR